MSGRSLILFSSLIVLGAQAGPSQAADVAQGRALARTLCSNCHIVAPGEPQGEVTAGVPSFMAMADKPGQTADTLQAAMLSPHPPMPQVQLTTFELTNLAAYILSLKGVD